MKAKTEEQSNQAWKRILKGLLKFTLIGFVTMFAFLLIGRFLLVAFDFNDIISLKNTINIIDTYLQVVRYIVYATIIGCWSSIFDYFERKGRMTRKTAKLIKSYRINIILICIIYELLIVQNVFSLLFSCTDSYLI